MNVKKFAEQRKETRPTKIVAGDHFDRLESIEDTVFDFEGRQINAVTVHTDKGLFSTSSEVLIKQLKEYFKTNTEPLEDVTVVTPRGKRYLSIEGL